MDPQQQLSQDDQQFQQNQAQAGSQPKDDQLSQPVSQQPTASVPSISREGEPIAISRSEIGVSASVPEMEVSPELQKETGVEVVHEIPQLTPADTQAGITHAKESVPVSVTPAATITLPMTQAQAQQTVKVHKKVKDSVFWFAMLILRQWQMAQRKK